MYAVEKRNKRLHVIEAATGASVYTPPDFVRVQTRQQFAELANLLNFRGFRDIDAIIEFETAFQHRPRHRPNASF